MTPHRFPRTINGFRRSSTVREPRSSGQGKWASEDLRSIASSSVHDLAPRTSEGRERRPSTGRITFASPTVYEALAVDSGEDTEDEEVPLSDSVQEDVERCASYSPHCPYND
jgi:hypothetical protein